MIFHGKAFRFCLISAVFLLLFQNTSLLRAAIPSHFTPTRFINVHFPEISPDEQELLDETFRNINEATANPTGNRVEYLAENFEILRNFLLLKSEYFIISNQPLESPPPQDLLPLNIFWCYKNPGQAFFKKTVSEEIRSFLWTLPQEIKLAWRQFADEYIEKKLNSEFASHVVSFPVRLCQIAEETPFSSYEAEFLELLAHFEWENGENAQAGIYWKIEFDLRSTPNEEGWKKFFLNSLPSLETLKNRISHVKETIKNTENSRTAIEVEKKTDWRVTMVQIISPSGEIVFVDELPEEQRGTLFPSRNRDVQTENQETPELAALSPDGKFLAARLGTHVSLWPEAERETRPQSFLVVLDLSRGGQLLWLKRPTSTQAVFIGNPLADAENLYIPVLQNSSPAHVSLEVYSLMDGLLKRRILLFTTNISDFQEYSTIYLPIRWTDDGNLRVGGPESGVQMIMTRARIKY